MTNKQETNPAIEHGTPSLDEDSPLHRRLSSVLDEYLTLIDSGVRIDDDRFLANHEDIADELRPHLQVLRAMQGALAGDDSTPDIDYTAPQQLGVYTLKREIGRGGQGIVYEAHDKTLNRQVALKVLPFAALLDRKQIDRFNNEAQAAARLHHPNIVPVFAVGVDRGVHYYAMQYVEGAPLSVAIQQLTSHFATGYQTNDQVVSKGSTARPGTAVDTTAFPNSANSAGSTNSVSSPNSESISIWIGNDSPSQKQYLIGERHFRHVAQLGAELADGLAHAHELGIVHRDIKPSNLLLDETGKAWIADFGLARIPNDNTMTGTGDILGTIRYMSPEQARGRNSFVDHRTDIYSLGVTLYELLTLQPVFGSKDREDFMAEIGIKEPRRPRRVNPSIPVDLENIILRAIESDPADRYESAAHLSEDLQRFLQGKPTQAKRATMSDRAFKWAKRHRRLVSMAAMFLILLTGGLATATWLIAKERTKALHSQSETTAALKEKDLSYQKAQANFEAARNMVDQLGVQTSEALEEIPGTERVRRNLLVKTKGYYDFLLQQTQDELLVHDRGVTLTRSARINEQLGDIDTALTLYATAGEELEVAVEQNPGNDEYQSELLNCRNNEAMLLARKGQLDLAATTLSDAIMAQQRLLAKSPENLRLAGDLACSQANLAFVLERSKQFEASKSSYHAAIEIYRGLQRKSPESEDTNDHRRADHLRQFALVLHNLSALLAPEDHGQANKLCREAIEVQQQLLRDGNHDLGLKSELAISLDRLADLQSRAKQTAAAETSYRNAITIQRQLVAIAPRDLSLVEDLAITLNHLGELYRDSKSYRKSEETFAQAATLLKEMVKAAPQQIAFRSSLGAVLYNQGAVMRELKDEEAAWRLWNEGLEHQQAAVDQAPAVASFRLFLDQQKASLQDAFADRLPGGIK